MKIGILTVYAVDFGSFFQATSLYYAIKEMGYDCEIINASLREKISIKFRISNFVFRFAPRIIIKLLTKIEYLFKKYVLLKGDIEKMNLKISKRYSSWSQLDEEYDLVVIGSDEIWSYTSKKLKYIPGFFGHGYHCPRIAYATSAASLKLSTRDKRYSEVQKGLKTFSSIGVRDKKTNEIVKKLIGLDSQIVIDPTLLNPYFLKENNQEVSESDYILVYGEEFDKDFIITTKRFARENNMKILSVSWNHDWCDEFIDVESAFMLQSYCHNCNYFVTSTFHGAIFAILHNKQFFAQLTEMRGIKLRQLLKTFNLSNRIYNKNIEFKDIEKINYSKVNKILKTERKKSYKYLMDAINKIKLDLL